MEPMRRTLAGSFTDSVSPLLPGLVPAATGQDLVGRDHAVRPVVGARSRSQGLRSQDVRSSEDFGQRKLSGHVLSVHCAFGPALSVTFLVAVVVASAMVPSVTLRFSGSTYDRSPSGDGPCRHWRVRLSRSPPAEEGDVHLRWRRGTVPGLEP